MDPDEVATGEIETVALRGWQQHGILRPLADSVAITFGFFLLVKEETNPHPVPNWACNEELTLALSLP